MTLTSSATVKAAAFKSGYNPSAVASAAFTDSGTNTTSSASYYVGKNGSDSYSCTQARNSSTPKLTIGAALACIGTSPGAGAGQTVEVAAGTYVETVGGVGGDQMPNGTSWSWPFTLTAKTGDIVTVRPSNTDAALKMCNGQQFAIVNGFVFDGVNLTSGPAVVTFCSNTSYVRVQNNEIMNANVVGPSGTGVSSSNIYMGNVNNIELIGNKIHDSLNGHGIYNQGTNNLFDRNEIYNIGGIGITFYGEGFPTSNSTISNNSIHNFALARTAAQGIGVSYGGSGNKISGNTVYNGIGSAGDGGVGIDVNDIGALINGNTVYNNTWIGISVKNSINAVLRDNVSYQNNPNIETAGSVGLIQFNNLTSNP